jgi:hypothetical protein
MESLFEMVGVVRHLLLLLAAIRKWEITTTKNPTP